MSLAWETTEEDILTCLYYLGRKNVTPEEVSKIHNDLDHDTIEAAALESTDFDEQVLYAYVEIRRQIKEMKVIS